VPKGRFIKKRHNGRPSMVKISTIGIDIAKNVF